MILHLDCVPISWDHEHNMPVMASTREEFLTVLKQHRNVMLSQSDWRVGVDSPLSEAEQAEWIEYRKYLRDLTKSVPEELSGVFEVQDPPSSGGEIRVMGPDVWGGRNGA